MSQFIGRTISLVSNGDIRYVGTLQGISGEDSTVTLVQVWCYGTEGRRGGVDEMPPTTQAYETIVFRGSDVKDLQVIDTPAQAPPVYSFPVQTTQQPQAVPAQAPNTRAPVNPAARPAPAPAPAAASAAGVTDSDFEFVSQEQLEQAESEKPQGAAKYDKKSSFFDSLGGDDNRSNPERRQNQRSLNMETFGEAGPARDPNSRGRGRGGRGGRGGQGRGRGRGRGGRGGLENGGRPPRDNDIGDAQPRGSRDGHRHNQSQSQNRGESQGQGQAPTQPRQGGFFN